MKLNTNRRVVAAIIIVAFLVIIATVIGANAQNVFKDALNDAAQRNAVDIMDIALEVALFIVTTILGYAFTKLPAKWRREAEDAALAAEKKLRDSLHMALRSGMSTGAQEGHTGVALVAYALKHTIKSVPDAIVGLTPTPKELLQGSPELILRQLPDGVRGVLERIAQSYSPEAATNAIGSLVENARALGQEEARRGLL